mmetsp:Transcript_52906/g.154154  ORF Transcript_52906/g.154154 Transcript_52906/m.154154 type:complete len:105 (+) Transcript_52906:1-315(+)
MALLHDFLPVQEDLEYRKGWFNHLLQVANAHGDPEVTMELVAVKQSTADDLSLDQEAALLWLFRDHTALFAKYRIFVPKDNLLIMDYAPHGDLVTFLNNDGPLD